LASLEQKPYAKIIKKAYKRRSAKHAEQATRRHSPKNHNPPQAVLKSQTKLVDIRLEDE
jgi:hypothetical protein